MKQTISHLFRVVGLMKTADKLRYYISLLKTAKLRKQFAKEYPAIKLPPVYYMYETYNLNYYSFYANSIEAAAWLAGYLSKYQALENVHILDWGCGPGRIIRHLPQFVGAGCKLYGSDYNPAYVQWCTENIPGITFKTNQLEPPLAFESESMEIIYGISIFTHLSEPMHYAWFKELMRVLKKGGVLFLTLHGEEFKSKLTLAELAFYDKGKLAVRANTQEGHRTFVAFQPEAFVQKLIGNNQLLEHVPGAIHKGKAEQDVWIIRKV